MSTESRPTLLNLRRAKKEPERPDFTEPDFSSWSQKLDSFIGTAGSVQESVAAPPVAASPIAPPKAAAIQPPEVETVEVESVVVTPILESVDDRPSLEAVLEKLLSFDGAMCVAVVDSETGMILGQAGSGVDMDLAAAGASVILRARLASVKALSGDEHIDDVLISLTSQVQIIHPLPQNPLIFTYLIGDKSKSSLAMARYKAAEADLQIQL